jgi:hypothetical protein
MKSEEIKVGAFVHRVGDPDRIREILCFQGADAFYCDRLGVGFCSRHHLAKWAEREVPRPNDWVRPTHTDLARLRAQGRLPEQGGVPPTHDFSPERSELAKIIVQQAIRDTELEDIHASEFPYPPVGSNVVFPDGTTIPWKDASHISQDQMKRLMIEAVNKVYTILTYPREMLELCRVFANVGGWGNAELDQELMQALGTLGSHGESTLADQVIDNDE